MLITSTASHANMHVNARRWFGSVPVRVLALVFSLTAAAVYEAHHLSALTDGDLWWHVRTGLWILQHHAIPRAGLFSQSAALPWIDSSWGFDIVTAAAYWLFGLRGLPMLLMVLQVGIAVALFALARGGRTNFWPAVILITIVQYSVSPVEPRSAICSMLLFALELALLVRVQRSAQTGQLIWLPLIFLVWANLDRQFSYGLLALALYSLAIITEPLFAGVSWFAPQLPKIRLSTLGAVVGACLLATFVSPYGYHLDQLVWQSATSSVADRYFLELHSMRFRRPEEFALMLLVMTAFFSLGRCRSRNLFLIGLMVVCAVISFRFQRDSWLVALASVGVLGDALAHKEPPETSDGSHRAWGIEKPVTAAAVLLVLLAVGRWLPGNVELMAKVSESFPVRASDYIRQNRLPQPLFNTYAWGGFLTWYLPEYPVIIDGRVDLYGDALNVPYFRLVGGEIPSYSHLGFASAQTILLQSDSPIAAVLATVPGFRMVYRDDQATVFVRGF